MDGLANLDKQRGGMRMRVDEGSCYKMWIRIFVLYVRPF